MKKALNAEFFRIFRSVPLLLLVVFLCFFGLLLSGAKIVGVVNFFSTETDYYELRTQADFVHEFDPDGRYFTLQDIKNSFALSESDAETIEELFIDVQPAQFTRCMWFIGGMMLVMLFLPAFFISGDIQNGMMSAFVSSGRTRRQTVLSKIIAYYVITVVISLLISIFLIVIYAPQIASVYGFGIVLRSVCIRALSDIGIMSVPMLIAFLMKRPVLTVMMNIPLAVIYYILNISKSAIESEAFIPIPPHLMAARALWTQNASAGLILKCTIISLVYVIACSYLSCIIFKRKRLI
ncbi:MAG: hypothetical protein GX111_11710 [Clostridiales bacterium]|jgi:hypothetical protein|nr:hypothetical protein [Clostridiales bacterium]